MANNINILNQKLKQIIALANECLVGMSSLSNMKHKLTAKYVPTKAEPLKFNMSGSAFMKKYLTKRMNGPKKFTLILAYLAKGDIAHNIELNKIEKIWTKMTRLIKKKYNRSDSIGARDNGWVDTKGHGLYHLCDSWQEIFD